MLQTKDTYFEEIKNTRQSLNVFPIKNTNINTCENFQTYNHKVNNNKLIK